MKRLYEEVIEDHLDELRQMLFLMGPRQVGKTTIGKVISSRERLHFYWNWDNESHRLILLKGTEELAKKMQLDIIRKDVPIVIFDEIHKWHRWKNFLKGFFDTYGHRVKVIVTGSARLDVFHKGGDSLMGRYFPYRLHPVSIAEIVSPTVIEGEIRKKPKKIKEEDFQNLYLFGGFPEPFLKHSTSFYNRWKRLRQKQLVTEELRDLSAVRELHDIEVLTILLKDQVAQPLSYSSLSKKIQVSSETIKRWLEMLKSLYFCFTIQPWSKNVTRSILKEPKVYLWDWSLVEDGGARVENFVASHLLKAVHFWTDCGLGEYDLYFLRDKEKREVDFLVTKDGNPWFLAEVKSSMNNGISKSLYYFQQELQVPHAFQLAFNMPFEEVNAFEEHKPVIVPMKSFLAQLV